MLFCCFLFVRFKLVWKRFGFAEVPPWQVTPLGACHGGCREIHFCADPEFGIIA
jgi:hypothetical protein